jgi:site-specific recombinase XerD
MQAHRNGAIAPSPLAAPAPINSAETLAAAFLAGYGSATRSAYARDLRHWGLWLSRHALEPLSVGRAHVDAYARALEADGATPATVARRLSTLAGFYAYAADEGLVERSAVARVRRPRVSSESPRLGLDREELTRFLAAASEPRDAALAHLLALNGLRVSEALGADVSDLGHERGHRTLALTRKGGRRGTAPLAPRTGEAIDRMLAGRTEGPLFVTRSGKRLDRHAAGKITRRLARAAGIAKSISPHSLRHTFVTAALDAGASLRDVQDAAGHADPRTTRRYDRARHSLDRHPTYAVAAHLE